MASFTLSHRISTILISVFLCSCNKFGAPKQDYILISKTSNIKTATIASLMFHDADKLAFKTAIDLLRKRSKDNHEFEIRIWHGFGLARLKCIIISRHINQWSALKISDDKDKPHIQNQNDSHLVERTLHYTINNNLRFLKEAIEQPDPSAPPGPPIDTKIICDETGYLFEIAENGKYCSTYAQNHSIDGQQLKQIFETLDVLFNAQSPRPHT